MIGRCGETIKFINQEFRTSCAVNPPSGLLSPNIAVHNTIFNAKVPNKQKEQSENSVGVIGTTEVQEFDEGCNGNVEGTRALF